MSTIKLKLTPKRCVHPKVYNPENDFYIYSCVTEKNPEVEIHPKYGTFTIKGKMQRLDIDVEYTAEIEFGESHPTFGVSYNVISIYQEMPKTQEAQKDFLRALITETQIKEIYNTYKDQDVIELFKNNTFDYSKVKGFGEATYQRVRKKIIDNLDYQELFSNLGKYGVTYGVIVKLMEEFGSAELAIQKVKNNPYTLTKIHGVGFKKADAIARNMAKEEIEVLLKQGDITRDEANKMFVEKVFKSPFRIQSGIKHIIELEQGSGHTYIEYDELIKNGIELLQVEESLINKQVYAMDDLYIEDTKIALKTTFETEDNIARWIKERLGSTTTLKFDVNEFIERMEKKHDIKLSEQQKSFFVNIKDHNVNLLVGYAGCVDKDTEFFNGFEWKKVSDYKDGDKILQYNRDGSTSLVIPERYHVLKEDKMTLIKNKSGSINQCLSDEHRVIYRTSKGHLAELPFHEVKRRHQANAAGFNGRFITTFNYSGDGIALTDDEIRVMVMVIADGHFPKSDKIKKCRINVKKERKKERLEILLHNANIDFTKQVKDDGYNTYHFISPIKAKVFDSYWYNCNSKQLKIIAEEIFYWDGCVHKGGRLSFSTHERESADFIQFVFSSIGQRATIGIDNRVGQKYTKNNYTRKTVGYNVIISKGNIVSLIARNPDKRTEMVDYYPVDGLKYCFTLPSGMWVMRRENRICITGNCGKSMLQKLLRDLLLEIGLTAKWLAPTGNAAKILGGYIGEKALTAHRAIGYGQRKEEKDLITINEDFVIIDETSMLDVFIASSILQKIKNPSTRILFIGDSFQIPSVASGLLLHDLLESEVVPTTKLDIVFRQSEGGVLDIATKIRLNKKFIDNSASGRITFGDNMIIHCVEQEWMEDGYKHYYNGYLKKFRPEEIMVLSPTKKGKLGTVEINKVIQSIVNPADGIKKEIEFGEDGYLRVGDYIINIKNTYNIKNINDCDTEIVNGDKGIIYDLITDWKPEDKSKRYRDEDGGVDDSEEKDLNGIYVKFDLDDIQIGLQDKFQLLHAWCLTMHKSQGGSAKSVLVIADKAHKWQLSANLLYTAITRATDFVVVICQPDVINSAMKKVENLRRNTFLGDLLRNNTDLR